MKPIRKHGLQYLVSASFLACLCLSQPAAAIEIFLAPDTVRGDAGESVVVSGQIGATSIMRGFTVYLAYDTTVLDVAEAPEAGTLVSGLSGLNFNYFDHPSFEPNVLEIGGTVFGTDLWSGPGELFRVRFALRRCMDMMITAPFVPFLVDSAGGLPAAHFTPTLVTVCGRVPAAPQGLTAYCVEDTLRIRWQAVRQDTLGRMLFVEPVYAVLRERLSPLPDVILLAVVADTFYADSTLIGEYLYHISALSAP
jgi:hypothetical protein